MIERYNFGFGFFGPLEQAKEGKFCKAEDVLEILNSHERLRRNFHNVCSKRDELQNECNALSDENYLKSMDIERLEKRNQFLASQAEDLFFKIRKNHKKLEKEIDFNRKLIRICGFTIGFLIAEIVLENFEFISGLF
jgi:hypothetical protein